MVLRSQAGLTPQQMEEYSHTFRHFDKDENNSLNADEFRAALQAQGIAYTEEEFKQLFVEVSNGKEEIQFEEVRRLRRQQDRFLFCVYNLLATFTSYFSIPNSTIFLISF